MRPRVQFSSGVHRRAVNEVGAPHGITAEMVSLGGTKMDEPAKYRVIVDRISHEVEYYRGALKHAVLQGATSSTTRSGGRLMTSPSTTPSWRSWECDPAEPCCCRRKGIPRTWI